MSDNAISPKQLQQKIKSKAAAVVAYRMVPLSVIYIVLFGAILVATNLAPISPLWIKAFGAFIFVVSLLTFILSSKGKNQSEDLSNGWRHSLYTVITVLGFGWGVFCAYTQYAIALSWTPVFVILLTLAISAGQMTALISDMKLLLVFQAGLLLPSLFVNLGFIGGTLGYSFGLFFAGFFVLMCSIGWIQNKQFWAMTKNHERLSAIIDALPGTLTWLSSNGDFLGVNQKLADLWNKPASDLIGKTHEKTENAEFVKESMDQLFVKTEKNVSGLFDIGKRKFLIRGQKYNFDSEAVLLGIDVTDQHLVQEQLEFQRAQSRNAARSASLGEVIGSICKNLVARGQEMTLELEKIWPLFHRLTQNDSNAESVIPAKEIFEDAKAFAEVLAKPLGVELDFKFEAEKSNIKGYRSEITLALLNLIDNSMEALADHKAEARRISLAMREEGGKLQISVVDNGPGVPDFLADVIFEPNFTTKEAGSSTGLGLSLTKEFISSHGGQIDLAQEPQMTKFTVTLPAQG